MTRGRLARVASAFVLAVVVLVLISHPVRKYEAALVLDDIAKGTAPSRLERRTPEPARSSFAFESNGTTYECDLYRPGEPALAGILLIPGAAATGRDDSRMVALATTLARARFAALVLDIPNLRELEVRSTDSRAIADAFEYLLSRTDLGIDGRAGIGAVSYAVGPAVLAALEPDLGGKVRSSLASGGIMTSRT